LAGEDDEKVRELEELRTRRMPEGVRMMNQREIIADILEGLAATQSEAKPKSRSKSKAKG
jgi:hypothetical protein